LQDIFKEIKAERIAQDDQWGEQNNNDFIWCTVLGEEYGEVCRASVDIVYGSDHKHATESDLRYELVQLAAVAVAFIECIDRGSR